MLGRKGGQKRRNSLQLHALGSELKLPWHMPNPQDLHLSAGPQPRFFGSSPPQHGPGVPSACLVSKAGGQGTQACSILCSHCIFWPHSHHPRSPVSIYSHTVHSQTRSYTHCIPPAWPPGTLNRHVFSSWEHSFGIY